jgi:hypothetical protein
VARLKISNNNSFLISNPYLRTEGHILEEEARRNWRPWVY